MHDTMTGKGFKGGIAEAAFQLPIYFWRLYRKRHVESYVKKRLDEFSQDRELLTESPNFSRMGQLFDRLQKIDRELLALAQSGRTLVVGPWISEVGFELLYWVPFLEWFKARFGLPSDRFLVLTRGGAQDWYRHLTDRYVDVFDLFSLEEFTQWSKRRVDELATQKQEKVSPFEKAIISRMKVAQPKLDCELLHPRLMYKLFEMFWGSELALPLVEERTHATRRECRETFDLKLPEKFVAAKFYFRPSFPGTQENIDFCRRTVARLSQTQPVVLLNTGLELDDHAESLSEELISGLTNVTTIRAQVTPRNNLAVQTYVVAKASLFVGTYGGFSYLGPFYGVPSISFYSEREHFFQTHLELMHHYVRVLNTRTDLKPVEFEAFDKRLMERYLALF